MEKLILVFIISMAFFYVAKSTFTKINNAISTLKQKGRTIPLKCVSCKVECSSKES